MEAIENEDVAAVRELAEQVNLDQCEKEGLTPLCLAVTVLDHLSIRQALVPVGLPVKSFLTVDSPQEDQLLLFLWSC